MVLLFNTLAIATAVFVACAHGLAVYYALYWNYLWFDIPVHTLGGLTFGFWAGAVSLRMKFSSRSAALFTAVTVFVVSVVWEIFEFSSGLTFLERGFWEDTASDISFALLGASLAYLLYLFVRRRTTTQ